MGHDDTDREEGVDFTEFGPVLEEISYPITTDELVEQYGDHELGRTNADPITVRELFNFMGDDTFESSEEARQMIMSQMPRESVGRTNYSDRGGSHPKETEAAEDAQHVTDADIEGGAAADRDIGADGDAHGGTEEDGAADTEEDADSNEDGQTNEE